MVQWMGEHVKNWPGMVTRNFHVLFIWSTFHPVFLWCIQCVDLVSVTDFCASFTWSIDNLKSRPAVPDQSPCLLPGFRVLNDFLAYHVLIPEVYLIVSSFFLQTPLTELTNGPRVCLGCTLGRRGTLCFLISYDYGCSLRFSIPLLLPTGTMSDLLHSLTPCTLANL